MDVEMSVRIPRILVVDDELPVREYLEEALRPLCDAICTAADLRQALRCMEVHPHDVLLADICMPGCNGMDFLKLAQQLNWDCAIILMTGHASLEQVVGSVRLQAADFLIKPFSLDAVTRAISNAYERRQIARQRRSEREELSSGLRERTEQLELTRQTLRDSYRSALETLVATLEARERETYAHSFRVRAYAVHVARLMNYPASALPLLAYAALLHDIGKIAVSDAILLKPGPLNTEEFEVLKIHPVIGERIVSRMNFLQGAVKIIRHHHERWDGKGYPDKLQGQQIPFGSRLFSVADTLDAMTSDRCYRHALSVSDSRAEILRCAGTQFDPEIAATFVGVSDESWKELRRIADEDAEAATIPEVSPGAIAVCVPELVQLSPATV
jgi:putative nucleotidyltransferase with HDIG domain